MLIVSVLYHVVISVLLFTASYPSIWHHLYFLSSHRCIWKRLSFSFHRHYAFKEKLEDTKGVIRIRKSKTDRQHNGKRSTKHYTED